MEDFDGGWAFLIASGFVLQKFTSNYFISDCECIVLLSFRQTMHTKVILHFILVSVSLMSHSSKGIVDNQSLSLTQIKTINFCL